MGVYIHYGLALDLQVAKEETEECKITREDVIRETGKHHDIEAYELHEDADHFQHYYNAEPEWSDSFGFRERFSIWHTGILIDMEEGKVRTEGMDRTLGLTTRLLRSALADLPPSRYLKVFLNM